MELELHAAVDGLSRGAKAIHALVKDVPPEHAVWRPENRGWSIVEVVHHLADEEAEDFLPRLEFLLASAPAPWPAIDPEGWVRERNYQEGDLGEALARFFASRGRNLSRLIELGTVDADLAYEHPQLGTLHAGDIVAAWQAHDLLHARQLLRLHHGWLAASSAPWSTAYAGNW
jgi:hypothetical protein